MNNDINYGPYLVAFINFIGFIYLLIKDNQKSKRINHLEEVNNTLKSNLSSIDGRLVNVVRGIGVGHEIGAKRIIGLLEELNQHRISNNHRLWLNLENKVFSMLETHRSIIGLMKHTPPNKRTKVEVRGSAVFKEIKDQYIKIYHYINTSYGGFHGTLSESEILDIAYKTLYYGTASDSIAILGKSIILYDSVTVSNYLARIPTEKTDYDKSIVANGGHQTRLGHYFRNLYNLIRMIDLHEEIDELEKYNLVKIVRSQLSTYEQFVLFATSQSTIGRKWRPLINKYKLIKNIPEDFVTSPNIKDCYPALKFEFEEEE